MLNFLLMLFSIGLATSKNILSKLCPKGRVFSCQAVSFFTASILALVFSIWTGLRVTPYILLTAVAYAAFMLGAQAAYIKAVSIGDFAISSLMYSCGFVVPSLLGALIFQEPITLTQILGLIVMIISFVLANLPRKAEKMKLRWLFWILAAMLSSGMIGLTQKLYSTLSKGADLDSLLTVAFLIAASVSLLLGLPEQRRQAASEPSDQTEKRGMLSLLGFMTVAALLGCVTFAYNKNNLFLSGKINSMILFPVTNGGIVVASAFADRFLFGKKIDLRKAIAIVLGIVAIVLIVVK